VEEYEYRDLIKLVTDQLTAVGAADIAEERHYVVNDPDTDERRMVEPRFQLIAMLQAFERFLAIQDRGTYDAASQLFNEWVPDRGPRAVIFVPTEGTADVNPVNLASAPDLAEVRENLRDLIDQLEIDPEPTLRGGQP
jgi:hypothetical protein